MLDELKRQVYDVNIELAHRDFVLFSWGNVSGIDRKKGLVGIKPSGVDYDGMQPEDVAVVDLKNGETVEG